MTNLIAGMISQQVRHNRVGDYNPPLPCITYLTRWYLLHTDTANRIAVMRRGK